MQRRPRLLVSQSALAENYGRLRDAAPSARCAASVKANAYGLGVELVVPVLWESGCREFFVAYPEEGAAVRRLLPHAIIYVFHGASTDGLDLFKTHRLRPVVNSIDDLAQVSGLALMPAVHFDTGMTRLGCDLDDLETVIAFAKTEPLSLVMSHLACADQPDHPLNGLQQARFDPLAEVFSELMVEASLANTAGVFLGSSYHYDLLRPGIGLYGASPDPAHPIAFTPVCTWQAVVLQVRHVGPMTTIGYGATDVTEKPAQIITIAVGYADGYLRQLGRAASVAIEGILCPVIGRVSMDLITVDATALGDAGISIQVGHWVEVMGAQVSVDRLAVEGGTIGYEILTRLGARVTRKSAP